MDPNERIPGTATFEDLTKLPQGVDVPEGVDRKNPKGWYVQKYTTRDGRTFYEFYRRGNAGVGARDPVHATVEGAPDTEQAARFKKEQDDAAKGPPTVSIGGVPHTLGPDGRTYVPVQTATGPAAPTTTAVPPDAVPRTEGTPLPGGGFDNSKPIRVWRRPDGTQVKVEELTAGERTQWEREKNPGGRSDAEVRAATGEAKTARQPETIGGKAYDKVTTVTTRPEGGSDTEVHYEDPSNPGVKIPTPLAAPTSLGVALGSTTTSTADGKTTKTTTYLRPDGSQHEVVDTASVAKPTDVRTDASTGRRYETIRNPDGSVKEEREITTTGPGAETSYTYPELRMAYGNITSEVMSIARDIYGRVGTGPGKITKEEADRLFKPIYDQAQLRVSEINGIVTTQKSVWDQQLNTANQRLDASTRMAGQAFGLAKDANLMAPGTGATAGQMVWDMMNAQRDFAGSMGGLKDPQLPGYLQAAMDMGPNTPPVAPGGPGGPPGLPPGPGGPPGAAGPPNALGLGAVGAVPAPGGAPPSPSLPAPLLPPPPPVPPVPLPGMGGPQPALGQGQDLSSLPGTQPTPMPNAAGGVTINIGGQPQQQQQLALSPSNGYLQPAQQPQRPSLQQHQQDMAGGLLAAGFDQDVIDQLWRQNTGRGLGG